MGDISWPLILAHWAILVFALTVHEAAHAWMALEGGDDLAQREGRLTLNPVVHMDPIGTVLLPLMSLASGHMGFLFWAKPVPFREEALKHSSYYLWIALAGPASNVALAVWGAFACRAALLLGAPWSSLELLFYFVSINVFLAVFNMIPLPPLDGSKIFFHLFVRRNPRMHGFWDFIETYGLYILIACVFIHPVRRATLNPLFEWAYTQTRAFIFV
jgi:Zn-dependent protease